MLLAIPLVVLGASRVAAQPWTVQSGDCTTTDSGRCVRSPNYPSPYHHSQTCAISINAAAWAGKVIRSEAFDTECCCDYLDVNNRHYKCSAGGPEGIKPTAALQWSSGDAGANEDPLEGGAGWLLCAVDAPAPAPPPVASATGGSSDGDDGDSTGLIIGLVIAAIVLVLCGCCCFYFYRKGAASKGPVTPVPPVKPAPAPTPGPTVIPPKPAPAPTPAPMTAVSTDDAKSSQILPNRVPVSLSDADGRPPSHWTNKGGMFSSLENVQEFEKAAIQRLLTNTFKNVRTRDRKSGVAMPNKLEVIHAQRIENSEMWGKYMQGNHYMKRKRPHRCTPVSSIGGEVLTTKELPTQLSSGLDARVNEAYLWHGTSPAGALGISKEGLRLRFSGSNVGTMYGSGIYLAECSSKSDEYAQDDKDGIYRDQFCLLLCRVVLGEPLHLTAGGEKVYGTIKAAIESDQYDSVLGDREASVGTYKEFVIYAEDQVYPEYLILYKRT